MPLERQDVERALESKLGFQRLHRDHRVFVLEIIGKVLKTKTSHGTQHKTIADPLLAQMARQIFVPPKFFVELVRCTKTRADYLSFLATRGMIPPEAMSEGR